jgi:hypothetical protein
MPNTRSLSARPKPVILTGYDLELDCDACGKRQLIGDDPDGTLAAVSGESVTLHALPGRYLLFWDLRCWHCGKINKGRLTISSRSAGHDPERRRVWGG